MHCSLCGACAWEQIQPLLDFHRIPALLFQNRTLLAFQWPAETPLGHEKDDKTLCGGVTSQILGCAAAWTHLVLP